MKNRWFAAILIIVLANVTTEYIGTPPKVDLYYRIFYELLGMGTFMWVNWFRPPKK